MTYDTQKFHKSGDIDDLSYNVTTPEGYHCRFSPNHQGLHAFKIKDRSGNNIFGSKVTNNRTIFGNSCHVLMEGQDNPESDVTGVTQNDDDEGTDDSETTGVFVNKANEGIESNEKKVRFQEAIGTVMGGRSKFSKRDQIRADKVRRLQHVAGFPSDETLVYSVMTNGIRNNPISKRDIEICNEMLGRSIYAAKEKRTMRQSNPMNASHQLVEVPPSIIDHYRTVQMPVHA